MFGKKHQEPMTSRYYVEIINMNFRADPQKRAAMLEDALNRGDAKGWKLISIETQGQVHIRDIVWDTKV